MLYSLYLRQMARMRRLMRQRSQLAQYVLALAVSWCGRGTLFARIIAGCRARRVRRISQLTIFRAPP